MSKHDVWLKAAGEARSFRRMYALAVEIAEAGGDAGLTRAASRVVQVLEGIIDDPIAPARQLQEARKGFTILLNHLVLTVDRELHNKPLIVPYDKPTGRITNCAVRPRRLSKSLVKDTVHEVGNSRAKVEAELEKK